MAQRELDGRGVRVAREVAAVLRTGNAADDALKTLRDDFEELQSENRKLRDRLDRIDATGKD